MKKRKRLEMEKLLHLHLTVNAIIDPNFIELNEDKAQKFVDELMRITGMKALGPLNWARATDLDFPGQSFVQMITTSHCSLHFFSDTNEIYFDLYSCKNFNYKKVIDLIDRIFELKKWHGTLYSRANDQEPKVEILKQKEKIPVSSPAI